MQGAEEIDLTVGDNIVYLTTRIGALPQVIFFEFLMKVRSKH